MLTTENHDFKSFNKIFIRKMLVKQLSIVVYHVNHYFMYYLYFLVIKILIIVKTKQRNAKFKIKTSLKKMSNNIIILSLKKFCHKLGRELVYTS